MKANVRLEFNQLTERSQKILLAYAERECQKALDRDENILQEIWIKLSCLILVDMGMPDKVMEYLGSFKNKYRAFIKTAKDTDDNGMNWLDEQIKDKIPDFPQGFIDELKGDKK